MNRRHILKSMPVLALLSFVGPASAHFISKPMVRQKRLEPNIRDVVFYVDSLYNDAGLYQLISRDNALWINSVVWEDVDGVIHSSIIRKNIPPGVAKSLPAMLKARKITVAVTCLPLANRMTRVELVG